MMDLVCFSLSWEGISVRRGLGVFSKSLLNISYKATRLYFHVGKKSDTITIVSNSMYRGGSELGNQAYLRSPMALSKKRGTSVVILQIEHPVPNFDAWKKAFDSDPVNRKQSGVRRYRVLRPIDNPNFAIIDLEFDSVNEAEGLLAAMREVWRGVQGTIIESPRVRIVETVESKEL
jgi:hypothetical protein